MKDKLAKDIKSKQKKTKRIAQKTLDDYKKFAVKGNAIDMAVGIAIGSAFTNIVNTLVSSTITPIIGLFSNKVDLSRLFISLSGGHYDTIEQAREAGALVLSYGELINAIINFIIISFVLFIIVRFIKRLNKKEDKREAEIVEKTTKTCPYCLSSIPIMATKCAYCTSELSTHENQPDTQI